MAGSEYEWRDQYIFHGTVGDARFDHSNLHIKPGLELENSKYLCSVLEGHGELTEETGLELVEVDGGVAVNFISKEEQKAEIEFRRPFALDDVADSMDIVGGKEYLVYLSYKVGSATSVAQDRVHGDVVEGTELPLF